MPNQTRGGMQKNRRERWKYGCLTDCVAWLFNYHPDKVPLFVFPRKGWSRRLKRFVANRGYSARWERTTNIPTRGTHIVCGDSLSSKRASHAVVYRNGRLVFDPEYPSRWSNRRVTHRLVIRDTINTDA